MWVGNGVVVGVGLGVWGEGKDAKNILFSGPLDARSLFQEHSPGGAIIWLCNAFRQARGLSWGRGEGAHMPLTGTVTLFNTSRLSIIVSSRVIYLQTRHCTVASSIGLWSWTLQIVITLCKTDTCTNLLIVKYFPNGECHSKLQLTANITGCAVAQHCYDNNSQSFGNDKFPPPMESYLPNILSQNVAQMIMSATLPPHETFH